MTKCNPLIYLDTEQLDQRELCSDVLLSDGQSSGQQTINRDLIYSFAMSNPAAKGFINLIPSITELAGKSSLSTTGIWFILATAHI